MEELEIESALLGNTITNIQGKSGDATIFEYGGGNGPARAGESGLWDDEDGGSAWDQL